MKKVYAAAFIVFALGIALRMPYIIEYKDVANLDEANMGVMGMDILKGDFPVFMYGHTYFGPLEAMFEAAALLFFDPSPLVLRLAMLVSSMLAVIFVWLGARKLLGEEGGFMAGAWYALPPVILVIWGPLPGGAHASGILSGAVIFFMAAKIITTERHTVTLYAVWGLVIGFSLWNHPGNLIQVLAAVAIILVADWRILLTWRIPLSAIGVAIGGWPFWVAIFEKQKAKLDFGQSEASGRPISELTDGVLDSIKLMPKFLGFTLSGSAISWTLTILFTAVIITSVVFMLKGLKEKSRAALPPLFAWLVILATLAAYTAIDANKYGWVQYRYYLPILLGVSLILGHAFMVLWNRSKGLGVAVFVLFIGANVGINIHSFNTGSFHEYKMDTRLEQRFFMYKELMEPLAKLGVKRAYVRAYDETPVIYESDGDIVAVAYTDSRLLKYSLMVQAADSPAFVMEKSAAAIFESGLASKQAKYRATETNLYKIYHDIKPPETLFAPVSLAGASATASPRNGDAHYALDGDMDTMWNIRKAQTGNEYLEIDLKREEEIARIDLISTWYSDAPARVVIQTSLDAQTWTKAAEARNIGSLYWTGPHLTWQTWEGFSQLIFKQVRARYVRITQVGQSPGHWHLREAFLYGTREGTREAKRIDWGKAMEFLKTAGIKRLIGDFYFSANVALKSEGAIWANIRLNNLNKDKRSKFEFSPGQFDAVAVHERDTAQVKNFLDGQGFEFRTERFGPYSVYHRLKKPGSRVTKLEQGQCRIEEDGLACELASGAGISVFQTVTPPELEGKRMTGEVLFSENGEDWKRSARAVKLFNRIRWTGSHMIGMEFGGSYRVAETKARFIKIVYD